MAATFPTSPTDGEYAVVNGVTYVYASATQAWTRVPGWTATQGPGGTPGQIQYNGLANFAGSPGFTFDSTTNAVATTGTFNATGNITGGNLNTSGVVSATGNITGGNLTTAGSITAIGNVTAAYINGNGSQLTGLPASYSNANVAAYLPTYTGNLTASYITATGNISATYFLGNGSQLTGISQISNGTSNVSVASSGNVSTSVGGNIITVVSTGGIQSQFITSPRTISANTTVTANTNSMSVGPITIADNVVVTIETGAEWSVV